MTRRQFLLVASIVPGIFGSVMMLAPQVMLENSLTQPADEATSIVTRWVGFAVFAVAWMTFFARRDDGSPALRAVLTGNVVSMSWTSSWTSTAAQSASCRRPDS